MRVRRLISISIDVDRVSIVSDHSLRWNLSTTSRGGGGPAKRLYYKLKVHVIEGEASLIAHLPDGRHCLSPAQANGSRGKRQSPLVESSVDGWRRLALVARLPHGAAFTFGSPYDHRGRAQDQAQAQALHP